MPPARHPVQRQLDGSVLAAGEEEVECARRRELRRPSEAAVDRIYRGEQRRDRVVEDLGADVVGGRRHAPDRAELLAGPRCGAPI